MPLEIGDAAPDFSLVDQHGETRDLASLRSGGGGDGGGGATAVALVFYPFAFSGICQAELCELRDDLGRYEAAGVSLVAVSCDSRHAHKAWAEQQGYAFPVLADFWPHGEVARAYGVFDETRGCAERATFLVGADGTIVDAFRSDGIGTARDTDRYAEALAKLRP